MSFFPTILPLHSRQFSLPWPLSYSVLTLFFSLLTLASVQNAYSDVEPDTPGSRFVKLELIADRAVIQPRGSDDESAARIGAHLTIAKDWHIYWQNSGDSGMPTKVTWSLPPGWRADELRWPVPAKFLERGGLITYGYGEEVVLISELFAPIEIPSANSRVELSVSVNFLVCRDICIPGSATSSISLPFSTDAPETPSKEIALIDRFDELTPKPLSSLAREPWAAGINVEPLTSHSSLTARNQGYFGVLLQGMSLKNPLQRIQFFPRRSEGFKLGMFEGSLLQNSDENENTSNVLLQGSVAQLNNLSNSATTSLSGVLVIETPQQKQVAYNIEIPITVGDLTTPNPRWEKLTSNTASPTPLTYLSHEAATTGSSFPAHAVATSPAESFFSWGLAIALLSAFFAGMILNLMPCVLPIISIKVLCILKEAHCTQRQRTVSALIYSAGILATFLTLALAVISLKAIGYHVGWGFQFQQPSFVFALFLVVFLLSLSLFEVFVLYVPGMRQANKIVTGLKPSLLTNFFDGILATLLSTPCTAPFLGTALAFAFTQSPLVTVLIFQAIGLGLALPYVYLVTHPGLMCRLPKPGEWMNRFKQFMGFLLLATALWLLFILHRLTGEGALWAITSAFTIFFVLWMNLWIKEGASARSRKGLLRVLLNAAALLFILRLWPLATALHLNPNGATTQQSDKIAWETFSEEAVSAAQAAGRKIFIDFTAEWCVTCKFNEQFAIETDLVAKTIRDQGVLALKADWTDGNIVITEALNRYGAQGVPLYVVIPAKGAPHTLSTLVTAKTVSDAIKAP